MIRPTRKKNEDAPNNSSIHPTEFFTPRHAYSIVGQVETNELVIIWKRKKRSNEKNEKPSRELIRNLSKAIITITLMIAACLERKTI